MKRQLFIISFLLMPFSTLFVHAQQNKHAQAMRTVFVETLDKKFPKSISSKWIPTNQDSANIIFTALDGAGLVPKNKIQAVKLPKNRAIVVPLYLDGYRFEFRYIPE